MAEQIRVLICDDHAVVREGLKALIESEPGLELAGEARDGIEAVDKSLAYNPDVTLMDLEMPRMTGIEAISEIMAKRPEARILVLTTFVTDEKIFPAIKSGALGYLLKDSSPEQLIQSIREVARGESSLHPAVAKRLLREISSPPDKASEADALTEREVDVLTYVAKGHSNQEIADQLFLSERTVRTHVSSILSKLHLANRTQAALYALKEGLASLEDE